MKTCTKCGVAKELEEFNKDRGKRDGRVSRCKQCQCDRARQWALDNLEHKRQRSRDYRTANKSVIDAYKKKWYQANKKRIDDVKRDYKLRKNFNITLETKHLMHKTQYGRCAVCNTSLSPNSAHVDHCHSTRWLRGLLCGNCNRGLGLFNDNTDLLIKAIKYLEVHETNYLEGKLCAD